MMVIANNFAIHLFFNQVFDLEKQIFIVLTFYYKIKKK
jgi:hypothetical protein